MTVVGWAARLGLSALMTTVVVACGMPGSAPSSQSPVFLDGAGTCPMGNAQQQPRAVCLHDQYYGNARAGFFKPQHGQWGLAYAFNCWGKKRPFGMRVGLTGADFSWGEIDITGRTRGRGFVLESDKVGKPVQIGIMYDYLAEVRSVCTWHVRGVDGPPNVIRRYVPRIPRRKL